MLRSAALRVRRRCQAKHWMTMSPRKRQIVVTSRARNDIETILAYTFRNWGADQERKYDRAIVRAFSNLRRFPLMGRVRDDLSSDLRSFPVEQHVIYYTVDDTSVTIVRILNPKIDPKVGADL